MPTFAFPSFPPFLVPLILINVTGHMALSGGRLSGSMFILKNGNPEALVGIFMALFSVIPVMSSLSIGRWVDRVGAGRVLRVGMVVVLLGALLPVVYLSLPSLFLTALMVGFGFSMVTMSAQHSVGHLVADATPAKRLANFGWFAMGHSASSVLGPFIAGVLIDTLGFRSAFAAMALSSCVALYLVFKYIRQLPGPQQALAQMAPDAEAMASDDLLQEVPAKPHVLDLLATKEMRRIYWVNALSATAWDLFLVMLPVLGHRLGYSASVIGTVFSMFALGTFTARAATPWLSRRFNEWQILRTTLMVVALVFCALPWASVAPMLMALGLLFGAAVGMSQPNILSLLHSASPPGRGGEAVGLRSMLSNGCSVVVPLAFGLTVAATGISALLFAGAILFASGVYPAHLGVTTRRNASQ